mgnify:CR=1 FL=1
MKRHFGPIRILNQSIHRINRKHLEQISWKYWLKINLPIIYCWAQINIHWFFLDFPFLYISIFLSCSDPGLRSNIIENIHKNKEYLYTCIYNDDDCDVDPN